MARILIADDVVAVRQGIARTLAKAGHEPLEAINGLELLRHYPAFRPHLVITDVVMPEMDGFEILRALRLEQPSVPVIVMSGCAHIVRMRRPSRRSAARHSPPGG